ncbi:helix-turn-helix domain-containing protein [Burkholderia vietnamiensis]|uniref:helix-turn-helix domain-containing protein n=1 Tax=Burkholderia vietnamiensis TaxID=60552 RepID=UPI000751B728|nr:helix-turn-helix domain-containing protein [Burkholderia vietnamiensis]KVF71435.1 hypothetical protein WJ17_07615 [Burkholderia vietnamiensis]KVF78831.1 hypothetical protein WJ18_17540 [Burkholderia vietnamiensis]KVF82534.1 hypothetical protein WJ19_26405 [Burkholderia vietnamiensis]KVF89320.1 hypothetical protein WJ20_18180 [Burkholderia vietnamiensis]KVF99850.1 hypothetical protein WJ22_18310 [Burkholderia vietnamiensis]
MHKQNGRLDHSLFSGIIANWPENTAAHQRARLLEAMKMCGGVTTLEAVRFLDIVDPRPRIVELRKEGYKIATLWSRQPSECGRMHRVGEYALVNSRPTAAFGGRSDMPRTDSGRQMTLALQI